MADEPSRSWGSRATPTGTSHVRPTLFIPGMFSVMSVAPEASVVGEIVPDREFYDYDSKYSAASTTALHIPASVSDNVADEVREMALRMYRVMGCEGYARVDFFVTGERNVLANEINTIPGFTSISMYPKLWEASGLPYAELLTRILELALARHERRARR